MKYCIALIALTLAVSGCARHAENVASSSPSSATAQSAGQASVPATAQSSASASGDITAAASTQ